MFRININRTFTDDLRTIYRFIFIHENIIYTYFLSNQTDSFKTHFSHVYLQYIIVKFHHDQLHNYKRILLFQNFLKEWVQDWVLCVFMLSWEGMHGEAKSTFSSNFGLLALNRSRQQHLVKQVVARYVWENDFYDRFADRLLWLGFSKFWVHVCAL